MQTPKRFNSIQDISCLGQCSLTVALPVISACGVECCVVPTAVLSTHTGTPFTGYTFRDLTEDIPAITAHWKRTGLAFDGIGTGYLGSAEQIGYVAELIDTLAGPDTLVVVDPVMADHGKFYAGFDMAFCRQMAKLCGKADIIVPNLTEACFLAGEEAVPEAYDLAFCRGIVRKLAALGAGTVVLTGLQLEPGKVCNLIYDCATGAEDQVVRDRLPCQFHGTGDLFASTCQGMLMKGKSLHEAVEKASDIVIAAIRATEPEHTYGVRFERCLGMLTE